MRNKKRYSDTEINIFLHDYYDGRVRGVHSEYRKLFEVQRQPFFSMERILTSACSFAMIVLVLVCPFSFNKPGLLSKRITAYYEYKQIDRRIPEIKEYIRDMDIFNIRSKS